ncbi:MAG: hypothetical protein U0V70_12045 [Terriglobia bacterium]
MTSRREFLTRTAASFVAASVVPVAGAMESNVSRSKPSKVSSGALRIKSVIRRDDTILRLGGNGDNWHMSWANDDRQYVSLCDGFGWPGLPGYDMVGKEFNSRMYAINGNPPNITFEFLPGYPELLNLVSVPNTQEISRYYCFGTLALNGRLYQFLSTLNHLGRRPDGTPWPGIAFHGVKLIYSPDNGRTWCNQDGSKPVVWEPWEQRSRDNMVFFGEPQGAFSLLTVLQMGRNYAFNRDGYVYVYAPNGIVDGTMNELVMFRVSKAQILNRGAYEFFAGMRPDGNARWAKDINGRAVVHTFPRGWVNTNAHPYGWHPSVVYNAPLGLYMMANWGMGCTPDGAWFGKPSYLGFWTAPNPWGPWTQIHEETAWTPGNDLKARAYQPQISPKWIAPDGKSFWLVWTDFQSGVTDSEKTKTNLTAAVKKRLLPYYAFNVQRVDLVIA